MLIGMYGDKEFNEYLDVYLEDIKIFREGIKEVARTGITALSRGAKSIKVDD